MRKSQREQWLLDRKKGLGGTDIAAIMGVHPYKTAVDVYLDKVGAISYIDNEAMQRGRDAEEFVLKTYARVEKVKVKKNIPTFYDKEYPFLFANIDGYVEKRKIIVEAKTYKFSPYYWKETIPEPYKYQAAHYNYMLDADRVDIPTLFSQWQYRCFTFFRDTMLEQLIKSTAIKFWHEHVLALQPPLAVNLEDVRKKYFFVSENKTVEATEELMEVVEKLREAKKSLKALKKVEDKLQAEVGEFLQDADHLLYKDKTILTFKKSQKTRVLRLV